MGSLPCPGPGTKPSGFGILVRKSNFYLKLQDLEKVFVHVDILVRKICLPLVKLPICDKSGSRFMYYYKLSLHVRDILPVHKFPNTVTQCNFRARDRFICEPTVLMVSGIKVFAMIAIVTA